MDRLNPGLLGDLLKLGLGLSRNLGSGLAALLATSLDPRAVERSVPRYGFNAVPLAGTSDGGGYLDRP